MKKLYSSLFILFLLPHLTVNAKTPEEGLKSALSDFSSNRLQQERDIRWDLSTNHPKAGFYSAMAQPYNSALNNLKNKGVIRALKPSGDTKLNEWTYLCTHNAFSSKAHGYGKYRQQDLSMTEQLNRGVRVLMLDAWLANGIIRLTHGSPAADRVLRPGKLFQEGMHMEKELKKIKKEFFEKPENKDEVVFLILEDYIDDRTSMDNMLENSGIASRVLKPSEWDPVANRGWPTFKWMNENEKQVVIFSDNKETTYIYPQWENMYENRYGKIDDVGASEQRNESKEYNKEERYFYLFNFFKDYLSNAFDGVDSVKSALKGIDKLIANLDYKEINSTKLRSALNYSMLYGLTPAVGHYPNFIALDFFEQGDGFKIVDDINKKTSTNPAGYYRVIKAFKAPEKN